MIILKFGIIALYLSFCISGFAQVQIDHSIQLTGTGSNAKIAGIKSVGANQDVVSVDYIQRDSLKFAVSFGSNNAYAVSLSPAITGQYTEGMVVYFIANFANTGAATLNVNNLGAETIKKNYNVDLAANDIQSGQAVLVIYDGTNFQMLGQYGSACSGVPSASGAITGLDSVCQEQTDVIYSIPGMTNATSYTWSYSGTGVSIVGTGNTVVLYFSASAISGALSVTGNNACGSSSTLTDSITVNATPSSAFTTSPSSANQLQSVTISTATTGATYSWSFPSGTPSSSNTQSNSVSWSQLGTYNASLTVTGNNGCSATSVNSVSITCHGSITFSYTGTQQSWLVPTCVSAVAVDAAGSASGGNGGLGGRVTVSSLPVTPGQTLYVFVGGTGGYNGGGTGATLNSWNSYSGGGATDLRTSASDLTTRILVAGGGGGGCSSNGVRPGGNGGGLVGASGGTAVAQAAGGGSQSAGGVREQGYDNCSANNVVGNPGSFGLGGNGTWGPICYSDGGGGGGGYYGGGGAAQGGGGGGSSYVINTATGVNHYQGYENGNGYITLTW